MKIIIQIKGSETGGVLNWIDNFSITMKQRGVQVCFAIASYGEGYKVFKKHGQVFHLQYSPRIIPISEPWKFPFIMISNFLGTKRNSTELKKIIRENDISAILTNDYLSIPSVTIGSKKIPVICVNHTAPSLDKTPFKLKSRLIGSALNKAKEVVCVGKIIRERLQPYTTREIKFLPSGSPDCYVDDGRKTLVKEKLDIPVSSTCIGTIGRFTKGKGYYEAVQVFEKLAGNHPKLHCVLAGRPSNADDQLYYQEVLNTISQSPYRNRIHVVGFMSKIDFYEIIDIFYLFSIQSVEAFGLVVIEAMSAYRPVIAPNVGGPNDIIKHNHSGFLVNPDDLEAYAKFTYDLIENSELRETISNNARETFLQQYSLDVWARNWIRLLNCLDE